ncbi:hypothetical protein Fsol_00538 [Candidatus Fokinia solitaria]|uniref:Outer membrane protein n=1 Tax=Candidatus Fokinia solitaria TaxID=1802984 RepID=A0A2U8BSS9_9RICK|nr:hypothetical protein [Candidatus Fokinia solitaria]AWD33330.1 hypothetical protein Fsol_00538 [Candidatus Fokinia solitaria]
MRVSPFLLLLALAINISAAEASVERYQPQFTNTFTTPNFNQKTCELGFSFLYNNNLDIKATSGIQQNIAPSSSEKFNNITDISQKSALNGISADLLYLVRQATYDKGRIFLYSGPTLSYFQYCQKKGREQSEILKELNFTTLTLQTKFGGTVDFCKHFSIGCFLNGSVGAAYTNLLFDFNSRKRITTTSNIVYSDANCLTPATMVTVISDSQSNLFDIGGINLYYSYGAGIRTEINKMVLELGFTRFDDKIQISDEKTYANVSNTNYQITENAQQVASCTALKVNAIAQGSDLIKISNPELQFSDQYLITFRIAYSF